MPLSLLFGAFAGTFQTSCRSPGKVAEAKTWSKLLLMLVAAHPGTLAAKVENVHAILGVEGQRKDPILVF